MSHLSILPTVLRDSACLGASLESLGLTPLQGGHLEGFAGETFPVELHVTLADGLKLGWIRHSDGHLALVADLQRLRRSRSRRLEALLSRLTRAYAAREAVGSAAAQFPQAVVTIGV
ncbi:MAG: DUF1257 domain-containing protein [Cyanobium sp.]